MTTPNAQLDHARRQLGLSMMDLWIDYFALGGYLDAPALATYLQGGGELNDSDHNLVTHVLNERFQDRGQDHPLAYRDAG